MTRKNIFGKKINFPEANTSPVLFPACLYRKWDGFNINRRTLSLNN